MRVAKSSRIADRHQVEARLLRNGRPDPITLETFR